MIPRAHTNRALAYGAAATSAVRGAIRTGSSCVGDTLFSEIEAGIGDVENTHAPNPAAIDIFADSILYVNVDECTSCTACYEPEVCPVGAIYPEDSLPDGKSKTNYNGNDPNKGHDHSFFMQLTRDVFAD